MTDSELLLAMYGDIQGMKAGMQGIKADMQGIKAGMQGMKADMQELKTRVTSLEMTLDNVTNYNIKLLAENHSNLIDNLNQAIRVADKTAIYEIQVNILTNKVDKPEQEITDIKNRIA